MSGVREREPVYPASRTGFAWRSCLSMETSMETPRLGAQGALTGEEVSWQSICLLPSSEGVLLGTVSQ